MLKKRKLIAFLITISLCFSTGQAFASSEKTIEDQINNNKNQINKIQQEQTNINIKKDGLQKDLEEIINDITKKGEEVAVLEDKLNSLQITINEKQVAIEELTKKIHISEEKISIKQEEIKNKEVEESKRSELLGLRLRVLYMNNQTDALLEYLFQSKSLIDLLERFDTIKTVHQYDNEAIKEIKMIKEQLVLIKSQLEEEKTSIENNKIKIDEELSVLSASKTELQKEKDLYNDKLSELKAMEVSKEETLASLSEKDRQLQDKIGDLTAYNDNLEKELKSILSAVNSSNSNSTNKSEDNVPAQSSNFLRPVPGEITSPFGPRVHPIYGNQGFHKGIDYGSPYGTSIKASKSGTIVLAKYSTSYGNYVIINHGNGVQTLYAHASSLNCAVGDKVEQGQVVAYVGSTGWSTGAHLHFEIRINEEPVNPQNYIPN